MNDEMNTEQEYILATVMLQATLIYGLASE